MDFNDIKESYQKYDLKFLTTTTLITTLIITIIFNLNIDFYLRGFIIPIILVLINYILILMFSSIDKNGPFIMSTSKYLKIISLFFIILSIIIFIKILFIPTIISIAICVITFIVSLCFYTLSEIFKEAINHKKELDYTI